MSRYTQITRTTTAAVLICAAAQLQSVQLQASSSGTAYVSVCCNAPSTAGVFSASTLKQTGTIVTGSGGDGIVLSPDGTKMFVTVDYKHELQVMATETGALLATVPVPISISGEPPLELAINAKGSYVYVFAPQNRPSATLMAINTTTYLVDQSVSLPNVGSLGSLLVSPDGSQLYFENGYANETIEVIDAVTLAPVKQIPVNEYPLGLAVTPSGLILMTDSSSQLLVINPATSAISTFPLPNNTQQGSPGNVISSPDSTTAYIGFATGQILALNITTGAILFDVDADIVPTQFAVSPDGSTLYSADLSQGQVWALSAFSISSQAIETKIRQLGPVSGLALTKDGQSLYVLNANESAIAAVDVGSEKLKHVTLGGVGINSLAIPPGGNTVWASQYAAELGDDLMFLNTATGKLRYIVDISGALVFGPSGDIVYVYSTGGVTAYEVAALKPIANAYVGQLTILDQVIPSPDGTRLYMSATYVSGGGNQPGRVELAPGAIYILDTSTYKYTGSIAVNDGMGAMALTPDGSTLVYTANFGRVHLASTATDKIMGTFHLSPTNGVLNGLALSPDGSTAYITDTENNLLLVADLATQTQQASYAVGTYPYPIVISPDGSEAWVATEVDLEIVNLANGQVKSVALPGEPSAIVFGQ
jgi:YVTN family beta-propeller protein